MVSNSVGKRKCRVRNARLLITALKSSKFKVQGSKFKVRSMPIRTFHNLRVGQRPMSNCLEKFRVSSFKFVGRASVPA